MDHCKETIFKPIYNLPYLL